MPPWLGLEHTDCVLDPGYDIVLASDLVCTSSLRVRGTLRIDSGVTVTAPRIEVFASGKLLIGTAASPASGVTIVLTHDVCADIKSCKHGELVSYGGVVEMYGTPTTPWASLTSTANSGQDVIHVDACTGWKSGDAIFVTPSLDDSFESKEYEILSVDSGCAVTLTTPLANAHTVVPATGETPSLRPEVGHLTRSVLITGAMHWKDDTKKVQGGQGITTMQMVDAEDSYMHMEYVRVENCGRMRMGGYCLHFHLVGECPRCKFIGNAVTNGVNKGITVHGTHRATVERNVVYDLRGASIYIEDGNEYDNLIRENLLVCPTLSHQAPVNGHAGEAIVNSDPTTSVCDTPAWVSVPAYSSPGRDAIASVGSRQICEHEARAMGVGWDETSPFGAGVCVKRADGTMAWTSTKSAADFLVCLEATGKDGRGFRCMLYGIKEHSDSDWSEQAAIYSLAASNHFEGNHVSGHENALYVNHQGSRNYGMGAAEGRVCLLAMPFGRVVGNVFHHNAGFGFYVNVAFPSDVETDADGFVEDWETCLPFREFRDNSKQYVVEDHLEFRNDFAAGGYDLGSLTFRRYTSIRNNKGIYLKTYHRGSAVTNPFCDSCVFVDSDVQGPGGSAAISFPANTFIRTNLEVNHHCGLTFEATGGLCASHYDFTDVELPPPSSGGLLGVRDGAGAGMQSSVLVMFLDVTLLRQHALGRVAGLDAAERSACGGRDAAFHAVAPQTAAYWVACPAGYDLRIIRIYSPDRGDLRVEHAGGADIVVPYHSVSKGNYFHADGSLRYVQQEKFVYVGSPSLARGRGYTFLVRGGSAISITAGPALQPSDSLVYDELFVLEYSDHGLPETSVTITLSIDGELVADGVAVSSAHDRTHITPYGPLLPKSGAIPYERVSYPFASFWSDSPLSRIQTNCDTAYCFSSTALGAVRDATCLVSPQLGCGVLGQSCCREELVRHDGNEYTVCAGESATVLWTGYHNIVEVTQAEYTARRGSCTLPAQLSPPLSEVRSQNDRETLSSLGASRGSRRYFVCSLPGHCLATFTTACP